MTVNPQRASPWNKTTSRIQKTHNTPSARNIPPLLSFLAIKAHIMLCFYIRLAVMLWAKTLRFYAKQGSSCIGQVEVKANTLKWATKKLFQLHLRKYTLTTQNDLQSWKQRQHQLPTQITFYWKIKCYFSLLLNQPFQIYIYIYNHYSIKKNNDFCVLFTTKQFWWRLQSTDKKQKELFSSHSITISHSQRPDCSSLENGAVSALLFTQSVSH